LTKKDQLLEEKARMIRELIENAEKKDFLLESQ
jgi:hypothetical protein